VSWVGGGWFGGVGLVGFLDNNLKKKAGSVALRATYDLRKSPSRLIDHEIRNVLRKKAKHTRIIK